MPFSFKMWQFLALWTVNAHPLNIFVMRFPLNIPSKLCEIKVVYTVVYVICNKTVYSICQVQDYDSSTCHWKGNELRKRPGNEVENPLVLFSWRETLYFIKCCAPIAFSTRLQVITMYIRTFWKWYLSCRFDHVFKLTGIIAILPSTHLGPVVKVG